MSIILLFVHSVQNEMKPMPTHHPLRKGWLYKFFLKEPKLNLVNNNKNDCCDECDIAHN